MKRIILTSFYFISISFLVVGCGNSKTAAELQLEAKSFETLKKMVASRSFEFQADASFPMQTNDVINVTTALLQTTGSNGTRQDLTGTNDYIIFSNDSVFAELSYFGELRVASYNSTNKAGINFETIPEKLEVEINEDEKEIVLKYKANSGNEQYDVIMLLFSNKKANVTIYSGNRTAIRYNGRIIPIEND